MNVVHSIDALVLREIHRRCNYDVDMLERAHKHLSEEVTRRLIEGCDESEMEHDTRIDYYVGLWVKSGFTSAVILPWITSHTVRMVPTELLVDLQSLVDSMGHKPFDVVTIHDEFKCHPNNMNYLRRHYICIMAALSESVIIDDILSQIYGKAVVFPKLSQDLSNYIIRSNYALS